jgi:hypothetical protein
MSLRCIVWSNWFIGRYDNGCPSFTSADRPTELRVRGEIVTKRCFTAFTVVSCSPFTQLELPCSSGTAWTNEKGWGNGHCSRRLSESNGTRRAAQKKDEDGPFYPRSIGFKMGDSLYGQAWEEQGEEERIGKLLSIPFLVFVWFFHSILFWRRF